MEQVVYIQIARNKLSNGDTLVFPLLNLFMRTVIHQGCFLLILLKEASNRFGCLS